MTMSIPMATQDFMDAQESGYFRDRLIHPFTLLVGLWTLPRWRRGFVVAVTMVIFIVMY